MKPGPQTDLAEQIASHVLTHFWVAPDRGSDPTLVWLSPRSADDVTRLAAVIAPVLQQTPTAHPQYSVAPRARTQERVYLAVRHLAQGGFGDPVDAYVAFGRPFALQTLKTAREGGDIGTLLTPQNSVKLTDPRGYCNGRQVNFGYAGGGPGNLLSAFRDDFFGRRVDGSRRPEGVANVLHGAFSDAMSFEVRIDRKNSDPQLMDAGFQHFGSHYIAYSAVPNLTDGSGQARDYRESHVLALPSDEVRAEITKLCLHPEDSTRVHPAVIERLGEELRLARIPRVVIADERGACAAELASALTEISSLNRAQADEIAKGAVANATASNTAPLPAQHPGQPRAR